MTRLVVRKSDPFVANSNQAKSTGDGKNVAAAAAKVGTPDVLSAIRQCPARRRMECGRFYQRVIFSVTEPAIDLA